MLHGPVNTNGRESKRGGPGSSLFGTPENKNHFSLAQHNRATDAKQKAASASDAIPSAGVYSKRMEPKRTRNVFAPLHPTPPPRSARKKRGVLISENAARRAGMLNHFLRAASSKTDRAQSVYWPPALRAAWMISRFSPGRNRTVMNSPR